MGEFAYFAQNAKAAEIFNEAMTDSTNQASPKGIQTAPDALEPSVNQDSSINIDALVPEVRHKIRSSIVAQCGMLQMLNIYQPLKLSNIYTNVNILEKISGRQRLEIADLLKISTRQEFERPVLNRIAQERVPGLEVVQKYPKLMVLGKPGSGKTTFLKYIAIQCISGEFQADRVPIFITFKDFAAKEQQPSLLEYIIEQLSTVGVTNTVTEQLLLQGKMLILLDGLDEVKKIDEDRVLQSIQNFSTQFPANHFVITCRIARWEYNFAFTEVEIADFDDAQIAIFATQWFQAKTPLNAERFMQKLKANGPIQELATNPLLLTLLCLVFEESADFSSNRAELYEEGLAVLLRKWDVQRNIEREQVYQELSVRHKENLLSQIALITFERGDYFFSQQEIEQHISDYIRNFSSASATPEALHFNSQAVLKSIEVQHGLLVERAKGIYSFSHLTFQEYFTARAIVASGDPQALEMALQNLVTQITDKRWHEVFLLIVVMLRSADYLLQLMKQNIDALVVQDECLQQFLTWVNQKSRTVTAPNNPVTVRAFYLDFNLALELVFVSGNLALDLALKMTSDTLDFNRTLDLALVSGKVALALALAFNRILTLVALKADNLTLDPDLDYVLAPELERTLQQLKEQLPNPNQGEEKFKQWWQANGRAWTETLRAVMIELRNFDGNWLFSTQQRQVLRQYYDANQLMLDCLNTDCYVTRPVREEIAETLLMPAITKCCN